MSLTQHRVESHVRLGPNVHAPADSEEIFTVERIALEDEGVKAEIAKLQLPEDAVVLGDPWIYGRFIPLPPLKRKLRSSGDLLRPIRI